MLLYVRVRTIFTAYLRSATCIMHKTKQWDPGTGCIALGSENIGKYFNDLEDFIGSGLIMAMKY